MTWRDLEQQHPGYLAYAKDLFIGNECDTDEYRESQPAKGLEYVARWAQVRNQVLGYSASELAPMLQLVRDWLDAIVRAHDEDHTDDPWEWAYAGSGELPPVLSVVWDTLIEAGEHPYGDTPELSWALWGDGFEEDQEK
jgi:hypothetical protein